MSPCAFTVGDPRAGCSTAGGVSLERIRGAESPPLPWWPRASDTAQDTTEFLGCECTWLGFFHQHFHRAALSPSSTQPVFGIALTQLLDLALVKLHEVCTGHLSSLPMSLWMAFCPFCVSLQQLNSDLTLILLGWKIEALLSFRLSDIKEKVRKANLKRSQGFALLTMQVAGTEGHWHLLGEVQQSRPRSLLPIIILVEGPCEGRERRKEGTKEGRKSYFQCNHTVGGISEGSSKA